MFINNGKISADGGTGGNSSDNSRGGNGGQGGQISFIHVGKEFTEEEITIRDIKHPHKQYWSFMLSCFLLLLKKYVIQIIIGLIVAYLIYELGWNQIKA